MNNTCYMKSWTIKMIAYWENFLQENPNSELREKVKEAIKTLQGILPKEEAVE